MRLLTRCVVDTKWGWPVVASPCKRQHTQIKTGNVYFQCRLAKQRVFLEALMRADGKWKYRFRTATSAPSYRAVSVQFSASCKALWWVENVNFMPYRLWLKSLMDTCLEHDRLISVFSSSFLSISAWAFFAFNRNGEKRNGKDMHKMRH